MATENHSKTRWLTPPEVARSIGIGPGKVVAFIEAGELEAANLASPGAKRPRYRIPPESVEKFLAAKGVAHA